MRIVFIGKPGSGKGTQAKLLSKALSIPHLSSGEILRSEVKAQTEFGKRIKSYMERGEIGPEKLIADTILACIERNGLANSYILDGFPRTMLQAHELDAALPPEFVLHLKLTDDDVISRLSKRIFCPSCEMIYHEESKPPKISGKCDNCGSGLIRRPDDQPHAIERRLEVFSKEVLPIVEYFRQTGRLHEFDASEEPRKIHSKIINLLSA